MKILFVSTNRSRDIMAPMPLGIASLIPYIVPDRHRFQILDLMFSENPEDSLHESMQKFQPDAVAFSIRNIENQVMLHSEFSLPAIKTLLDLVRKESAAKVIVGGAAFGVLSKSIFRYLQPDAALAGEGENLIGPLLEAVESGVSLRGIPGVMNSDGFCSSSIAHVDDLDRLFIPDRKSLLLEDYRRCGSLPNVVTKRGCAFRCIFCETPVAEGGQIRAKGPKSVADEAESLLNLGFEEFFFTDPVFNFPGGYAESVACEILRRGLQVKWNAILHPRFLSRDQLSLLRRAGLSMAFVASDHASKSMLNNYSKGISVDELAAADHLLERFEIPYSLNLLLGGPGETESSVSQALDFIAEFRPAMVGIRIGLRIYPGTTLHSIAVQEGKVQEGADLLEPVYYLASGAEEWIVSMVLNRMAGQPCWKLEGVPACGSD